MFPLGVCRSVLPGSSLFPSFPFGGTALSSQRTSDSQFGILGLSEDGDLRRTVGCVRPGCPALPTAAVACLIPLLFMRGVATNRHAQTPYSIGSFFARRLILTLAKLEAGNSGSGTYLAFINGNAGDRTRK